MLLICMLTVHKLRSAGPGGPCIPLLESEPSRGSTVYLLGFPEALDDEASTQAHQPSTQNGEMMRTKGCIGASVGASGCFGVDYVGKSPCNNSCSSSIVCACQPTMQPVLAQLTKAQMHALHKWADASSIDLKILGGPDHAGLWQLPSWFHDTLKSA